MTRDTAPRAPEPGQGVPFDAEPDPAIEAAILRAFPDFATALSERYGSGRYVHARVDLDDDGREEIFVYLLGPYFCGTGGCTLLLLHDGPDGFALVTDFPISRTPIVVSEQRTNGWRDLIRQESGGGAPTSYVRHQFDGSGYVEHERTPDPPEPDGLPVLSGELDFDTAVPLEPPH